MANSFNVPAGDGTAEFVEKRSRFIGTVRHTETEEEALRFIAEQNELHKSAAHNVYAYSIRNNNIMRYSDNGEPQGTAGLPVLDVFRHNEVFDFCCVVTRYFGGILLGTGGLCRAYSHAAKIGLEAAGIAVMRLWAEGRLTAPYNLAERCEKMLRDEGVRDLRADYGAEVTFSFFTASEDFSPLASKIFDMTNGKLSPEKLDERFMAIK